jgi:Fe-S-cluster containining protein
MTPTDHSVWADQARDSCDAAPQSSMTSRLRELYEELAAEIAQAAPVCDLSGRCCRFREFGHTLFLSRAEAEVLVADAPEPRRPLDDGETCPWQDERGQCSAREARPLGCRIYYCDPAYRERGEELSEKFIGRLKRTCDEHGWEWGYAPLHTHLRRAVAEGRLSAASAGATRGREDDAIREGAGSHVDTNASSHSRFAAARGRFDAPNSDALAHQTP